jgi:hypothetical protein
MEVESINPNTPVTSNLTKEGTVQADATGGPLSFDELDEVLSKGKKAKPEKKEADAKPKQEKSKDLTSDTDKGKEPKAEPKKSAKPEETEEPEVLAKPPRKTIKAKYEDNELDLDEESLIPVKINGKEEFVQVKDLLGNYSGKVAWDKKFSEVDQSRRSVAAQELKLKQASDSIRDIYNEQDPTTKLFKMANLVGVDPVEFRQKFFDENISLLEKYYSMTEDERKADALAYETNIHKMRADTLEKGIKEKEDYQSLHSKIHQLRASHDVSEQEFIQKYDQLEQYVNAGQMSGKLVTPEYIMQSINMDKLWSAAEEKLDGLDLGWDQQTKIDNLRKLISNATKIGLKPGDMAEMVDELWGVSKARNKIQEKQKENQEFLSGKKPAQQARAAKEEVVFFDEI